MKKLLLLLMLPCAATAQTLNFTIEPYVVQTFAQGVLKESDTCDKLQLTASIGEDSASVEYALYKKSGALFELGTKKVPNSVVSIIITRPINITALNQVLSFWNIEAIRQD